jgi:hypothetical protein
MNASMRGQILLLFAASLIVVIAVAGLLIDGGFLLSNQRQAQAAADTGALAAAQAVNDSLDPTAAARTVASANGFVDPLKDCDGALSPNQGVEVNLPPVGGLHIGDDHYVEVITTRAMRTAFAKAFGMPCLLVSARAVARISSSSVATCSFCVLTKWAGDGSDNSFTMDNTGHMRVDGDILISGPAITGPCTPGPGNFRVCGTALHLYHTGGTPGDLTHLSARTISIAGGWSSAAGTQAKADGLAADLDGTDCDWHPDPLGYPSAGYPTANVCVGMPPLLDPYNLNDDNQIDPPDAFQMDVPEEGVDGCPDDGYDPNDGGDPDYPDVQVPTGSSGSPNKLNLSGTTPGGHFFTICPGLYFGGFSVVGDNRNVHVKMMPGVYFMIGGGFTVSGTASIDGSAGVFIYNSGGTQSFSKYTDAGVGLVPTCTPGSPPPPRCLTVDLTGPNSTNAEVEVTYTLTLTRPTSPPGLLAPVGGTVDFYDGPDLITDPDCEDVALVPVNATKAKADCLITYAEFGTRWITAVYSGDPIYAPVGDNKSTNINPNANLSIQDVFLCTGPVCGATGACNSGGPCNQILLHAPPAGEPYAGLLIFQDRTSSQPIRLWPGLGLPDCVGSGSPPSWMTDGVPGGPNPTADVPDPCGGIGGLSGTIYAPKSKTVGGSDGDATVNIQADGVANLQIIAGRISAFYNRDLRLAFREEAFANGAIRLVE